MASFIKDIEEIRQRAIEKIEDGPVTSTYNIDKDRSIEILNEALATEIVCVLRYMHHYFMATGVHGRAVADEFKEHADEEREHADLIGERIQQLGGKPDFNPASLLQRSVSQYVEGETLADMIREDLIAERMVIEVYQEMIRFFGDKDPTTRRMIEHILAQEEEHAADLSDFLYIVDPETGQTEGQDPGTDPLELQDKHFSRGSARSLHGTPEKRPESEPFSGRGTVVAPAANAGGVSGRPMNRRDDIEDDDVAPPQPASRGDRGGMTGGTRSPKVLQKNRKNKRIA